MVTKFLAIFMHLRNSGGQSNSLKPAGEAAKGSIARGPRDPGPNVSALLGVLLPVSFLHPSLPIKTEKCQPAARHTSRTPVAQWGDPSFRVSPGVAGTLAAMRGEAEMREATGDQEGPIQNPGGWHVHRAEASQLPPSALIRGFSILPCCPHNSAFNPGAPSCLLSS